MAFFAKEGDDAQRSRENQASERVSIWFKAQETSSNSIQAREEADDEQEAEAQPDLLACLVLHYRGLVVAASGTRAPNRRVRLAVHAAQTARLHSHHVACVDINVRVSVELDSNSSYILIRVRVCLALVVQEVQELTHHVGGSRPRVFRGMSPRTRSPGTAAARGTRTEGAARRLAGPDTGAGCCSGPRLGGCPRAEAETVVAGREAAWAPSPAGVRSSRALSSSSSAVQLAPRGLAGPVRASDAASLVMLLPPATTRLLVRMLEEDASARRH